MVNDYVELTAEDADADADTAPEEDGDDAGGEDGAPKILSKKEKEKLKKEKEKVRFIVSRLCMC